MRQKSYLKELLLKLMELFISDLGENHDLPVVNRNIQPYHLKWVIGHFI